MYKTAEKTLFIGKNVVFVDQCPSTNDLANRLIPTTVGEGTVVIANQQSAGKGQRGNSWESKAGQNLTFSIILRPGFLAINDQFFLTVVVALGVYDYLKSKGLQLVQIKWPNDLLVNEKKICGILIENQLQGGFIASSILGIGINILQEEFSINTATSLKNETKNDFSLPVEFDQVLSFLEKRYLQLRNNKRTDLLNDYLKGLYRINQPATYKSQDEHFIGTIQGVNAIGKLELLVNNEVRTFDLKEIQYV